MRRGAAPGGRLWLAAMIKGAEVEDVQPLLHYLTRQVQRGAGIEIRLNQSMSVEAVAALKPDAVVVATGGNYALPDIPGIQRWNVRGSSHWRVWRPGRCACLVRICLIG